MIRVCLLFLLAVTCFGQDVSVLQARERVLRVALGEVLPSVVRIDTIGGIDRAPDPRRPGFRQADGPTTGLIVGRDGWILTSSFNFVRDPQVITVRTPDGARHVARLVARDQVAKLTLLKIDAVGLTPARFAETDGLRPGQTCFASGFGHGSSSPTMSVGIISALHRMDGIALQTDARISPASYGGPLCDLRGRVLGICVPLAMNGDELAGAQWYDSGIAFAIRPDFLLPRLERMKQGETLERGYLGVFLDDAMPVVGRELAEQPVAGRLLTDPPSGPAKAAGMQQGDVLVSVNGTPCPTPIGLRRLLVCIPAGDSCTVAYHREGDTLEAELRLATTAELLREAEAEAEAAREAEAEDEPKGS